MANKHIRRDVSSTDSQIIALRLERWQSVCKLAAYAVKQQYESVHQLYDCEHLAGAVPPAREHLAPCVYKRVARHFTDTVPQGRLIALLYA